MAKTTKTLKAPKTEKPAKPAKSNTNDALIAAVTRLAVAQERCNTIYIELLRCYPGGAAAAERLTRE
jgi:hypothetical protein